MASTDLKQAAESILRCWLSAPAEVAPLGSGHINDTFLVRPAGAGDGASAGHVLQRLNRFVFPRPQAVMRNLARALAHDRSGRLVAPLPTAAGEPFAVDAHGDVWRLFPHLQGRSFERLPADLIAAAGAAFGSFLAEFADFDGTLEPAIDGFHNLGGYLAALDDASRTPEANAALRDVDSRRDAFAPSGTRQVIHGDCKVNNLLFHPKDAKAVAVLDLDTVMVGDPAWDFGDLARSVFIGAEESAGTPALSPERFERLCRGFAAGYPNIDDPVRYARAPAYMSFMLAVRFLTDHLRGDAYFKVGRRGDNLRRAQAQLDLARQCQDAVPALEGVLRSALGGGPAGGSVVQPTGSAELGMR